MASMGVELTVGSSADLQAFVKSELTRWGDVVKRYNPEGLARPSSPI